VPRGPTAFEIFRRGVRLVGHPCLLGEADLAREQARVPDGVDLDDTVALKLHDLHKVREVEGLSGGRYNFPIWQNHLAGECARRASDGSNPVATSELDPVWVIVHVNVGKDLNEQLHSLGVRSRAIDWLWVPRDVRNHIWVVHSIHSRLVASVESAIPLLENREKSRGPIYIHSRLLHAM